MTRIRVSLGWLVIAAFAIRSLVPAGYMPDFTGNGSRPTIILCGGMDPERMAIMAMSNDKSKTPDAPSAHHHDAPCPFSVNAVFAFDGLGILHALTIALFIAFLTLTALVLVPQRRFGNASSRSPPRFS